MSPDAHHNDTSAPDAETKHIEETVHQLILMRETGPKSAKWHRARVQAIWRLQRMIDQRRSQHAEQRDQTEAQNDHAGGAIDDA